MNAALPEGFILEPRADQDDEDRADVMAAQLPEGFVLEPKQSIQSGITDKFTDEAKRRRGPFANFGEQFVSGIADMASGTINATEKILPPFSAISTATGGKLTLSKIVSKFTGIPTPDDLAAKVDPGEPVSIAGSAGRMAGMTLGLALGGGRGAGAVKFAPEGAGPVRAFSQNLIANLGAKFKQAPIATTLSETALGASSGAGGGVANRMYPDSNAAQLTGEVIGGVLPLFTPTGIIARMGKAVHGKVFSESGLARRAGERIDRAVGDARGQALQELDAPTTLDPKTGRPVLSILDRTGDQGLLSLQRDILNSSDLALKGGDQQLARANEVLQESYFDLGQASPVEARELMDGLLETRIRVAAVNAEQRIASVGAKLTEEQANTIAADEVQKALNAAVEQRKQLFQAIDKKAAVPSASTTDTLDILLGNKETREVAGNVIESVPDSQLSDIPQEAKDYAAKHVGKETDANQAIGLMNRLNEVARQARKDGAFNKARIADLISDSIIDDIGNAAGGPEVKQAIDVAMGFSGAMRERFRQGALGKLLAQGKEGGRVIDPSLLLERSIAVGKAPGRQALDDLLSVFDSPEAPPSTDFLAAAEEFIKNKFSSRAFPQGDFNKNAAAKFISDNSEMLDRMPILKQQLEDTVKAGRALDVLDSVTDPRISKTALYLKKGPDKAFTEISNLPVAKQGTAAQKLINLAAKDPTGQAPSGLRKSYLDYIYERSLSGQRDVTGRQFPSGFKLAEELEKTKAIAGKLFDDASLKRLDIIKNDLVKLEKSRTARASEEGILGDIVGKNLEMIFRMAGAAAGRKFASASGSGASIQMANYGAKRFQELGLAGIQDPGRKLIIDTVEDETLFREILQSNHDDPQAAARTKRRLDVWFAAVYAEHGKDVEITPK